MSADDNKKGNLEESTSSKNSEDSEESFEDFDMDRLQRFFKNLLVGNNKTESTGASTKVLDEVNLEGIVNYIKSNNCKNIITLAGAGISTSAGIPDFRTPGIGLYDNLQKYNLPHPQAIFELDYFHTNPKPFFVLAKELYPGVFKPTICHYFIRLLHEKHILLRHYTQNIDTLERVAGIPTEQIVEAHGTFYTGHCLECRHLYSLEWMKVRIFKDEIPICEKCPGVVKPDIVFFGESLPEKFHECTSTDFSKCDLLIILGSSLVVEPFASLVDQVHDNVPRLLINREKVGQRNSSLLAMLGMGGGLKFDADDNTRDVAWLGDCDEGCALLAEKLGWADELKALIEKEHERIDMENKTEVTASKKATDDPKEVKKSDVASGSGPKL